MDQGLPPGIILLSDFMIRLPLRSMFLVNVSPLDILHFFTTACLVHYNKGPISQNQDEL